MNADARNMLLLISLAALFVAVISRRGQSVVSEAASYVYDTGESAADYIGDAMTEWQDIFNAGFARALDLLKRFEGFSELPYPDARGNSIGYGHFIQPGEAFASITESQAAELLARDASIASDAVTQSVTAPLNANQFAALVSLAYNIGTNNFRNSTLVRKLNAGDAGGAAAEFGRWIYSAGSVNQVLISRRAQERAIFEA